jgi:hypothetical protein
MNLIVGCPIAHRSWIAKQWVNAAVRAAEEAALSISFVIVCPSWDRESSTAVRASAAKFRVPVYVRYTNEGTVPKERIWGFERYERLAACRNVLLKEVRLLNPDLFLSLDSDILIGPFVISRLIKHLRQHNGPFDAVAGKTWLSMNSRNIVNYASYVNGSLRRQDTTAIFKTDIIMALKLMSRQVYMDVDYQPHLQGEDIGWSINARKKGYVLGFDGSVVSKHVMSPSLLTKVDPRVGW